jgi:hypothetical protein
MKKSNQGSAQKMSRKGASAGSRVMQVGHESVWGAGEYSVTGKGHGKEQQGSHGKRSGYKLLDQHKKREVKIP